MGVVGRCVGVLVVGHRVGTGLGAGEGAQVGWSVSTSLDCDDKVLSATHQADPPVASELKTML